MTPSVKNPATEITLLFNGKMSSLFKNFLGAVTLNLEKPVVTFQEGLPGRGGYFVMPTELEDVNAFYLPELSSISVFELGVLWGGYWKESATQDMPAPTTRAEDLPDFLN